MKRLTATTALCLVLAACSTENTAKPDPASTTDAPVASVELGRTADAAWRTFESFTPSFDGAARDERQRFADTTCRLLDTNADLGIATAVSAVEDEYLLTTARAGALVVYSARWHCGEHLFDVNEWADEFGLFDALRNPPKSPRESARETVREFVPEWADLTDEQFDNAASQACIHLDENPDDVGMAVTAVMMQVLDHTVDRSLTEYRSAGMFVTWFAGVFDCIEHREAVDQWMKKETE